MKEMQQHQWRFKDRRGNYWDVSAYAFKKKGQTGWECRVEVEFLGQDHSIVVYEDLIYSEEISLPRIMIAYHSSVSMVLVDIVTAPPALESFPKAPTPDQIVDAFWAKVKKDAGVRDSKKRTWGIPDDLRQRLKEFLEFIRQ